jgi:tRNA(Arg) A34 adenosine deaminase TadA
MIGSITFDDAMKVAIEEARVSLREGNHGFGAVVVKNNRIISRVHDCEETQADPTAHAEMGAIREACMQLGKDLSSCAIVSTHEPCPMCAAAIVWAHISTVVYGHSIRDSVAQGRRRIRIECAELFERADARVAVQEGILKKECSVLYNQDVRKELNKLRGASDEKLLQYDKEREAKRIAWHKAQPPLPDARDPLRSAYQILLRKLGIGEDQAPVVYSDAKKMVFHSRNFCPTLEACLILGLDTRRVCRLSNEKSTDALVKQVDQRLLFSRNYQKIRPAYGLCEEWISFAD